MRLSMKLRGNDGYGRMIAEAVWASSDNPDRHSPARSNWLDSWIEPGPARDRARRWLSMWLKGDLKNIPKDQAARFLEEMAHDVLTVGADKAVDRFIDKILPKI